ncbi:hypothetical protein [Bradyrhizobium lablabi]|uniref:hypothetical protein n=1 Tax=Bradyrhizobium lablabi TaxID=722472 RepID=UPI0012AB9A2B|nr:hypothetical protein [Bradyrhizobium lablabi]
MALRAQRKSAAAVSAFRNFGKQESDFEKRVATALDRIAHFGIDVAGFARARAKRQSRSDAPTGNGASAFVTSR